MNSFRLAHNIHLDPVRRKEFELNHTQSRALRETSNITKQAGDPWEHFQECITNNSHSSSTLPILKNLKRYEGQGEQHTSNVVNDKEEGEVTDSSFDTDLNKEDDLKSQSDQNRVKTIAASGNQLEEHTNYGILENKSFHINKESDKIVFNTGNRNMNLEADLESPNLNEDLYVKEIIDSL